MTPQQTNMMSPYEWWSWVFALVLCIFVLVYHQSVYARVLFAFGNHEPWLEGEFGSAYRVVSWIIYSIICLVATIAVIRLGRNYEWAGFSGRSLWEWLQLLIVPAVITIGGFLFATQQEDRQQQLENERAQAVAYQAYIEQMQSMLLEHGLRESPEDQVRKLARAQTLNVLLNVEGERKSQVLRLLAENELIQGNDPVVNLGTADLRGARFEGYETVYELLQPGDVVVAESQDGLEQVRAEAAQRTGAPLDELNLSGAQLDTANLDYMRLRNGKFNGAIMNDASLIGADLEGASLQNARLFDTDFTGARLTGADLEGALMQNTVLSWASLSGANLSHVTLTNSCLMYADIRGANLAETELTNKQLQLAVGDENTLLPGPQQGTPELHRPASWNLPIDQQLNALGPEARQIPVAGDTRRGLKPRCEN